MLSARGIPVVVGAENHSSMLGGLGGGFLSLDIWVAEEDSEEAIALLRDVREPRNADLEDLGEVDADDEGERDAGDDLAPQDCDSDDTTDAASLAAGTSAEDARDAFQLRIDRRRRTGIALLLGCCITFGTAHMLTRAWLRGIALGAVELVGILHGASGHRSGTIAIVGAVAADVIGAVWRVWAAPLRALPEARLYRR
jgi:hypothetical protein